MAATPLLLKPACELAPRVVLPADPHLALALAQALTEGPRMFNHHAGLWGYTGTAPDGAPLSVQATGLGGPAAAAVVWELAGLGAETLVRVGECRALEGGGAAAGPPLGAGALFAVSEALPEDGTSAALGAREAVAGEARLTTRLAEAAGATGRDGEAGPDGRAAGAAGRGEAGGAAGRVASSDLLYDPEPAGREARWRAAGCVARDLESAAVLRVAALRGLRAGCVLGVVEPFEGARLDREAATALGLEAGRAAWAALARA